MWWLEHINQNYVISETIQSENPIFHNTTPLMCCCTFSCIYGHAFIKLINIYWIMWIEKKQHKYVHKRNVGTKINAVKQKKICRHFRENIFGFVMVFICVLMVVKVSWLCFSLHIVMKPFALE